MQTPFSFKSGGPTVVLMSLLLVSMEAHAAINNADVLDNVLARYSAAASAWATTITGRATWLFWTLALISMVWTFGMMALRKADLGEFFAEFVRFTMFTGFFWWLLMNGSTFATDIMNGLRSIAATATGTGSELTPSGIVDIGFDIFFKVLDKSTVWAPIDSATGIVMGAVILIVMALIGVNMLLLLVSGWILAYAGVFFLGFGGSRWTSDMAINYYKTVLNIGAQLFTMVLLVGIGKSFVDQYYNAMTQGLNLKEMAVMMVVAVVLLALVNKVPALIGDLAAGGGTHHALGGGFGAGAAIGAAAMGGAAMAAGGAAIAGGAASMGGGAQALMAAIQKAQAYESAGGGVGGPFMAAAGGTGGKGDGGGRALAEAMGDPPRGGSSTGSSAKGGGMGSPRAPGAKGFSTGTEGRSHSGGGGGGGGGAGANADAKEGGTKGGESGGANSGGAMAKAGRVAAGTAGNLAKGAWDVGKAKVSQGIQERVSQTFGGQVASAIKAQGAATASTADATLQPSFEGNSVSWEDDTSVDAEAEIAAFRDRDAKPS